MSKVIGVIQARMGSSRLPGKVMMDLAGHPLVWHVFDRMRRVDGIGEIVLATTTDPRNDTLDAFGRAEGLEVYRHDEECDLAGRVSNAIRDLAGEVVLKTGGDCPLIDPDVLQRMVDIALADPQADFVSNRVRWSYPLGLSADVISRRAIEWCDANLTTPEDRELFAVYVRDHPDQFKVVPIVHDSDLSHHNWAVDEPADAKFVRDIFDALYVEGEAFGLKQVLNHLNTTNRVIDG